MVPEQNENASSDKKSFASQQEAVIQNEPMIIHLGQRAKTRNISGANTYFKNLNSPIINS